MLIFNTCKQSYVLSSSAPCRPDGEPDACGDGGDDECGGYAVGDALCECGACLDGIGDGYSIACLSVNGVAAGSLSVDGAPSVTPDGVAAQCDGHTVGHVYAVVSIDDAVNAVAAYGLDGDVLYAGAGAYC